MGKTTRMAAAALVILANGWPAAAAVPGVPSLGSTDSNFVEYAVTNLPSHFTAGTPSGNQISALDNTPADNPISDAGALLGRVLFYDTRLSHNDSTSCASCHRQENGFSDPNPLSEGFEGELTGRNSMGLSNARYYENGRFFWDERSPTLEHQVLQPIQNPVEMGIADLADLEEKLSATDFYPKLFQAAFGDTEVTSERMSLAMSQFVRSMVSYQSKFDEAFAEPGPPDFDSTLTVSEERGHQLFAGNCAGCHTSNAQAMDRTHNIGLDLVSDEDQGTDEGAGDGLFKSPSLRNVEVRGTYMHDGRFASLEEVVQFYSTGIQDNPNLSPLLRTPGGQPRRFNFSPQEIEDLVAFLGTLTDESFLSADLFSDPFVPLPGDYNGDGMVDAADYLVWRTSYGQAGDHAADGNLDGLVDAADYSLWRANFGATWETLGVESASLGLATVPEPGAVGIAAFALGPFVLRRTRGRRSRFL